MSTPKQIALLSVCAAVLASTPARAGDATGYLSFDSVPWTKVFENGEFLASTPIFKRRIAAGTHTLRLVNEGEKLEEPVTVVVPPGQTVGVIVRGRDSAAALKPEVVEATPPPPAAALESATAVLARAEQLFSELRFDEALTLARALVRRPDATRAQQLAAFQLWGSAAAVSVDPIDAELPFRMLLRAQPTFEFAAETPPKILTVFRKVQGEERAPLHNPRDEDRLRMMASVQLLGDVPTEAVGGRALALTYDVVDPARVVRSVRASYRREGEEQFSALQLTHLKKNLWRGVLGGVLTASDEPYRLEYFVEAVDAEGPLVATGSAANPERIAFTAGLASPVLPRPYGLSRGFFWSSLSTGLLFGVAAGAVGIGFQVNNAAGSAALSSQIGPTLDQALAYTRTGEALVATAEAFVTISLVSLGLAAISAAYTTW